MLPPRNTLEWFTGSRLRAHWVRTIVGLPDRGVWLRDLYRGMRSMSTAHETVVRVERIGLIRRVQRGGFGYFEVDFGHPLYDALRGLVEACDLVDERLAETGLFEVTFGSPPPRGTRCLRAPDAAL